MKKQLDFLCVGFQKSGTTTLDAILRKYDQIVLPEIKETQYFHWKYKYCDSLNVFWNRFFDLNESGSFGVVEPEFDFFPYEIYRTFGKDVKLIFIMRNPIERLYSYFRMELKLGNRWIYPYYDKKTGVSRMFDRFVIENMKCANKEINPYFERGKYMRCIEQFLQYFPKENMHFIIFEDYISNPQKTVRELVEFLGFEYKEMDYSIIENKGNRVSKIIFCLIMNGWLTKLDYLLRTNKHIPIVVYKELTGFIERIRHYSTCENNDQMSKRSYQRCKYFFKEDKKALEIFLQRDLSKIWFE